MMKLLFFLVAQIFAINNNGLLRDNPYLIFMYDDYAFGNTGSLPVKQMTCVGGNAQHYAHLVRSIYCANNNYIHKYDYPKWNCTHATYTTGMKHNYKLDKTNVTCANMFANSCYIQYELVHEPEYKITYDNIDIDIDRIKQLF